jgi:hypothetical protein
MNIQALPNYYTNWGEQNFQKFLKGFDFSVEKIKKNLNEGLTHSHAPRGMEVLAKGIW